jgi:carboxyl-terminal processing protease
MKYFKHFFLLALYLIFTVHAKPPELTASTTKQKIQEILRAHSTYKFLNDEVVKKAMENFLDELDPLKCYLIENEVASWQDPSKELIHLVKESIENDFYGPFEEIFHKMEAAIARREQIELWLENQELPPVEFEELKEKVFAKTEEELKVKLLKIRSLQLKSSSKPSKSDMELTLKRLKKYRQKKANELFGQSKEDSQKNLYAYVIKSIASALDNHTVYFTPNEANSFLINVQQRLFGIGAQLRDDLDGLSIQRLLEGGPAHLSKKFLIGDKIVAVNGETIIGMDMEDAVEMIRGPQGTNVNLTICRKNESGQELKLEIAIIRDEIILKESRLNIYEEPYGDGIVGRLHLHSFYQDPSSSSYSDLKEAIEKMQKSNKLKGLILDLRNNGGGLLPQAVEVCSLFLGKGIIASIKDSDGNVQHLRNLKDQKIYNGPLIVLINRASASASEIVAQTLQDYGRALLVGDDHSFGKGTYQTFTMDAMDGYERVNPSGEYKVTRGMYYTVSGKTPQLKGAEADIVVPGVYSKLDVGEKFSKNALEPDRIKANFVDDLSDIHPLYRFKVRKIYIKDQELGSDKLKNILNRLQENSKHRIENNKPYQEFLKLTSSELSKLEDLDDEKKDHQLNETFNIMKDMILLYPKL